MTIDEIELYDVEAVDEILSHLSDENANVVQRAISSLCGMITIRDKYIKELREMEEGTCHCQLYIKTKDENI